MVKRWVIEVKDFGYLICGTSQTGYKFGVLLRAYRFTNRTFVARICEELQSNGYNAIVRPVKKTNYALTV